MPLKPYRVASLLLAAAMLLGTTSTAGAGRLDPSVACVGARPGAHVETSKGTGGTLNFLFRASVAHSAARIARLSIRGSAAD